MPSCRAFLSPSLAPASRPSSARMARAKSTLLKTLLGIQPPIAGKILCPGRPVFGYVPQSVELDTLYPLTGFDVALMGVYGRIRPGGLVSRQEQDFVREGF